MAGKTYPGGVRSGAGGMPHLKHGENETMVGEDAMVKEK